MEALFTGFEVWTFKTHSNGRWIWIVYSPDGEPFIASRADFDDIAECVGDATRRGYRGSVSEYVEMFGKSGAPECSRAAKY